MNEINAIVRCESRFHFSKYCGLLFLGFVPVLRTDQRYIFRWHFFVSMVLAFLYKCTCPTVWWMTGRALVCRSGTASPFHLQFCSFIPETGTCQTGNWADDRSRRCLWWSGQLDLTWEISTFNTCTWNLCYGVLLRSVVSGNVTATQCKKKNPDQPKPETWNDKGLT